ncbi:MAG TPA: hypothetical protein VEO54_01560 [Thermoanaerobaculia bacterium]|nr:hypothetical protein [Thermoanaerobaculia bacterium]
MRSASMQRSELATVAGLMRDAARTLSAFPPDFVPAKGELPDLGVPGAEWAMGGGDRVDILLKNPAVQEWLNAAIDRWPDDLHNQFLQSSSVIGQILTMFGAGGAINPFDSLGGGLLDLDNLEMLMAFGQLEKESKGKEPRDFGGAKHAMMRELMRRAVAKRVPCPRTLTTLLGHDALLWLTAPSERGSGNIQPHEFARTGWPHLWSIANQIEIEQELLRFPAEAAYLARILVALSWTVVAMASFIEPAIFLGEREAHVSSIRPEKYTISYGYATHTLFSFHPAAMTTVVKILADGLTNPLLSAADLMWIGAALARVRTVEAGHGPPLAVGEEQFDIFLSHRGRDAKLQLSAAVQDLQSTHGVFLDCMTLPRGVVNRSFVYGSLARSKKIVIVESRHFNESDWCRKEAWFAGAMAENGLASVDRVTLTAAEEFVKTHGPVSTRRRSKQELSYPITHRILKDVDYWGRTPNLHSLKESGHPTDALVPLQDLLLGPAGPGGEGWIDAVADAVTATMSNVAAAEFSLDLWVTALQYAAAAFASTSVGRSKMEVRGGIDDLTTATKALTETVLHLDPLFRVHASQHLSLLAGAATIALAGFELDPAMESAIRRAVGDTATVRDGVLLLDVRKKGALREFRLKLLRVFVQANLGSVGIIQDAADEVHRGWVESLPLEVLPCVTLYPGMAGSTMPPRTSWFSKVMSLFRDAR